MRVVALVLAFSFVWALTSALDTRAVLDTDVVNLALAIDRYELAEHQPHPPGYLGYVLVLRALHAVTGLDPIQTTKLAKKTTTADTTIGSQRLARLTVSMGALLGVPWDSQATGSLRCVPTRSHPPRATTDGRRRSSP